MDKFFEEVKKERQYQKDLGWQDEHNSQGSWVCYIVNYVSRFAMPISFDAHKYTFDICLIKTAALCLAAYEWYQNTDEQIVEWP